MHALGKTKGRLALVAVLTLGLVSLTGSSATAALTTIDLCAVPGTATLTGSVDRADLGLRAEPGQLRGRDCEPPGPHARRPRRATR